MCEFRSISDSVLVCLDFASRAHGGESVFPDGEPQAINTFGAENQKSSKAIHGEPVFSGEVMGVASEPGMAFAKSQMPAGGALPTMGIHFMHGKYNLPAGQWATTKT